MGHKYNCVNLSYIACLSNRNHSRIWHQRVCQTTQTMKLLAPVAGICIQWRQDVRCTVPTASRQVAGQVGRLAGRELGLYGPLPSPHHHPTPGAAAAAVSPIAFLLCFPRCNRGCTQYPQRGSDKELGDSTFTKTSGGAGDPLRSADSHQNCCLSAV